MESKEIVCKEDKCTGCYACYNSCPKNCISMNEDQYGFLHPIIDIDKCTNCNLCRKTCPSINEVIYRSPKLAYAAWALDKDERRSSTSGGAASIFSNYILENGGVVFGSSIEDKIIKHIKINKKEDLIKLKGSKYVHSRIGDTYKEAKIELELSRIFIVKKRLFKVVSFIIVGVNITIMAIYTGIFRQGFFSLSLGLIMVIFNQHYNKYSSSSLIKQSNNKD
ncbi:Ferredoxin [Clostridium thermopalmarium DSM 5974]|uniref:Ferredoxin n=2 Tax=Clostridium TaxID=1485 RepID=A0A2T0AZ57_9CLOT|nr:Ferredoxin [Clostridium thermopalmarium DSM 5974]PVZ28382.1 coenzyme F420 hydrogenase/dehydrogenase beta subunit [Clostridium thermopalmarium DSM 5974]